MPKIFIEAPTDRVFEAMCDLPRHANWAVHDIKIESAQEGPPKVGNVYQSAHGKAKKADEVTVTELVPNERFCFHVDMPNKMEFNYVMTVSPQGGGTLVTRNGKPGKVPLPMIPLLILMMPLFPLISRKLDGGFLKKMKADMESASQ